ncbi:cytochrome c [bacterium]|nr:cytochrome c [bacterium]
MNNFLTQKSLVFVVLLIISAVLSSCLRGQPSEKPPFHVFLDMDDQPKYQAFEKNDFFDDGSAMRKPVTGTREFMQKDWAAVNGNNPLKADKETLLMGQERYNIYCSPCHGMVGDGKGIVAKRGAKFGYVAPSSLHDALIKEKNDAHYFDVITNGIRNMGPYGSRTNAQERWAIVHYVRALQLSQDAPSKNVPEKYLSENR